MAPMAATVQLPETAILPDLAGAASLLARDPGGGDDGIDSLPPEAMALLFAAMLGAQVASSSPKGAAGSAAPVVARSIDDAAAPDVAAPTVAAPAAAAPEPAADPARALEAVLRDLAGTDAAPHKDVVTPPSGAIDLPTPRAPARDVPSRHAAPIQTPVAAQGWSDELAGRIAWIARDNLQSASIRLTPEHLGPLDVQISVRDGDAVITFGANHAETRAALEQSLPRLRELLAAQGIALTQANVSEHPARQDRSSSARLLAVAGDDVEVIQESGLRLPVGLVDLYA